jgi:hypothetical protein
MRNGVIVKLLLICFCNLDKLTFGLIVVASGGQNVFPPDREDDRCCTLCVHRKYHPNKERHEKNKFIVERDCRREYGEPLHFKATSAVLAWRESRTKSLTLQFGVIEECIVCVPTYVASTVVLLRFNVFRNVTPCG